MLEHTHHRFSKKISVMLRHLSNSVSWPLSGLWGSELSTTESPTPRCRSPVFSVLDTDQADISIGVGVGLPPSSLFQNPMMPEGLFAGTADGKVIFMNMSGQRVLAKMCPFIC
jgi:hypothetical protein